MEDLNKLSKKELIDRLSRQTTVTQPDAHAGYNEHDSEIEKLNRMSNVSNPMSIPFSEKCDHKNIMLYTALNKHVGPLHPDNARRTMERWKRAGVQLYTRKRTDAEVEAFMQTEEYISYKAKFDAERKRRRAQSTRGRQEQMIKDIAKQTAQIVAGKDG